MKIRSHVFRSRQITRMHELSEWQAHFKISFEIFFSSLFCRVSPKLQSWASRKVSAQQQPCGYSDQAITMYLWQCELQSSLVDLLEAPG